VSINLLALLPPAGVAPCDALAARAVNAQHGPRLFLGSQAPSVRIAGRGANLATTACRFAYGHLAPGSRNAAGASTPPASTFAADLAPESLCQARRQHGIAASGYDRKEPVQGAANRHRSAPHRDADHFAGPCRRRPGECGAVGWPARAMCAEPTGLSRRSGLAGLARCGAWALQSTAQAHHSARPVIPPQPEPDLARTAGDARASSLARARPQHLTAWQAAAIGCSANRTNRGAVFGSTQQRVDGAAAGCRRFSVAIDALGHEPWAIGGLHRFHAGSRCRSAGVLRRADVDGCQDSTRGRAGGLDRCAPQGQVFDRRAERLFRTRALPRAEQSVDVARKAGRFVRVQRRSGSHNPRMNACPSNRAPDTCDCGCRHTAHPEPRGPAPSMWGIDVAQFRSQPGRRGTGRLFGCSARVRRSPMTRAMPAGRVGA